MTNNESEMHVHEPKLTPLFGPDWLKQKIEFLASDDRVRGGSSEVIRSSTISL